MIDRINTIRENAERILSSGLKGPQGCAERIITALAALEAEMREPEWIDGVPHWTPALIARVKQLAAEIDAPPAQQAQPTEPSCPTCKGSGEGGSHLVPGTMANFVDGPCRDCGGSGLDGQASAEAVPSSCTHALKLLPEYFADVKTGTKTFELRKDDRGFKVGDVLRLKEWSEPTGFTGKQELRVVTSVLRGPVYGLADGFVILSIASPQQAQAEAYTYASRQATMCAGCGKHKHTPLRIDAMGGYVCLTCIDQKLGTLLGKFGYPEAQAEAVPQEFLGPFTYCGQPARFLTTLKNIGDPYKYAIAWETKNGRMEHVSVVSHPDHDVEFAAAPQQKGGT